MKNIELENPYGFIYITTNLINGKRYIGQKVFDNTYKWKSYIGSGRHFLNAVKTYGKENFIRNIVDVAYSPEELNEKEIEWIKNYNAVKSNDFYNIIEGGNTGNHLKNKNSIPVVCIDNNLVFKSTLDASLWSGYTVLTIKNTYKKKHILNNKNEKLIFRPLTNVKEKCNLCCVCGNNFRKRNNAHKKCDKCSNLKGKIILSHDFEKSNATGIQTYKLNDGWVIRKIEINDKICEQCGLPYEKTKKYQRRCVKCLNIKDRKNHANKITKQKEEINV